MPENTWWKHGIVYQIYPRSFQDSNGDGLGDLQGIASRLDYLQWLGVEAVWISPIYPSPMADFGYDVSDYCGVDARFGTLEDFDALVAEAHRRGLKVILDFVPNHSSDQHPWFRDSRSSPSSAKRDWYIWRDPAPDGGPPNNWISNFGGSAWEIDPASGQYYYHAFLTEQPDLNWRNPAVREAMHDALRFWLKRGVDGFRVDVIWHLIKDAEFRDNPPNPAWREGMPEIDRLLQVHSTDQPHVHDVIAGMRDVLEEFDDRVLIGEIYLPVERLVAYYGEDLEGAHLPFNFQLIHAEWNADTLGRMIAEYEEALPEGGWPNWVLGNHDQRRIVARVGPEQARVAAMLLLTLRGTPTMYYGDEIGMPYVEIPPEAVRDPWGKNEPGHGRDPQRTPMQWDGGPDAGFTTGEPWLPLAPDHRSRNVESFRSQAGSILKLYRRLIELRRTHLALSIGDFRLRRHDENVLGYERTHGAERLIIVLNLGKEERTVDLGDVGGEILLSTLDEGAEGPLEHICRLRGGEGLVIRATPPATG